jgi:hypothetical protein
MFFAALTSGHPEHGLFQPPERYFSPKYDDVVGLYTFTS